MTATKIQWTRPQSGVYVSRCGNYEIARTLGVGSSAVSDPWWVCYVKAPDGWKRITARYGTSTLAFAKARCQAHADANAHN